MAERESLPARIERLRGLLDLSARELSALAGLHASHVRQLETLDRTERATERVTASTAAKMAKVFGVTLDWLIDDVGDEPSLEEMRAAVARARRRRTAQERKTGTAG